jgi:hypothetical protein
MLTDPIQTDLYAAAVGDIRRVLANLTEFADSLPAPNEGGEVPGITSEMVNDLIAVREYLGDASEVCDAIAEGVR